MSVQAAKHKPVYMIESGPVAGVIAAGAFVAPYGYANVISFDMGGTTAKVSSFRRPAKTVHRVRGRWTGDHTARRRRAVSRAHAGNRPDWLGQEAGVKPGSMPVGPCVGPRSAGAVPGPVCYGQGGTTPTITDANPLLGRLNPAFFLGGEITLDPDASREAIVRQCAEPLRLDPPSRAWHRGDC